jgi:hypothetical protein
MRTMIRAFTGLALVGLLASPAFAQGRGFGRGGMMGSLYGLLGNESVQKELKLDDKQVEKAKEVSEKIRGEAQEKFQGFQDLSQEERREKMQTVNKELTEATLKAVADFMKPEQITRLKQISYQARGVQAFADPEVVAKLNLTDSQKTEIRTISEEQMEQMRTIRQDNQGDFEAIRKKSGELTKETLTKITAKLNDEQQKAWKELIGAPFEIQYPPRPNN